MFREDSLGISVIIPVYNTSKYLSRCLDSVLAQTYKHLQIIVIDDGSTDQSRDIINTYKSHDNIEVVFNEVNSGAAYCRNLGLKLAKHQLVGFIDSDDYIPHTFYEKLYDKLKESDADIAVCDFCIVRNDNTLFIEAAKDTQSKYSFVNHSMAASPCNKLFKKDLLMKFPYPQGIMNEDIACVIPAMVHAQKICHVPWNHYYYVQHNASVQNSALSMKRFDIFEAVDLALDRIKDTADYEKYKNAIVFNQLVLLLFGVLPKERSFFKRQKYIRVYNRRIHKYNIDPGEIVNDFLSDSSRKMKIYYNVVLKLSRLKLAFFMNYIFVLYKNYKIGDRTAQNVIKKDIKESDIIEAAKKQSERKDSQVTISVIIPNYNYQRFFDQRMLSILEQKIKLKEIIILDDCSSDDSREKIMATQSLIGSYIPILTVFNEQNSGSAFKQWEKGIKIAAGDYIWIAEADDYCAPEMLEELIKPILADDDIAISYCNTAFMDCEGNILPLDMLSMIDIMRTGHWNKSYVNEGFDELMRYAFLSCTIGNVSSVLFKSSIAVDLEEITGYKQTGDWLFYILLMAKGKVAYTNQTLNYYRLHGNNVSSTNKKADHIKEIASIHQYINSFYGLNKNQKRIIIKRYKYLMRVWGLKDYCIDKDTLLITKKKA